MSMDAPRLPLIELEPTDVVASLQYLPGGPTGYRLRKVFLVKYWRWEYEVVDIPHGRLFLTGRNASGKSTALAAAMVLLDGSLRPERLDTSGKRARQIADYVLLRMNEEDQRYRYQQRHSYLAAEFECIDAQVLSANPRPDGQPRPETITLGMAFIGRLHGHAPVETIYFVLADGARLERDVPLLTVGGAVYEPRALLSNHFRGYPGRFSTRSLGEYQQLVAEHLFGYRERADLEQLAEWLSHLRRPDIVHATASLAALSDRLKTALPPLDESVARKLVEAFEQLAELRRDRARSYEQLESCKSIEDRSRSLAEALVRLRAWLAVRAADDERKRLRNLRDHQREAEKLQEQVTRARDRRAELALELERYDGRIQSIESSALLRDHEARIVELRRRDNELEQTNRDVDGQRRQVEKVRLALAQSLQQIEETAVAWREQLARANRHFVALTEGLRRGHSESPLLDALSTRLSGEQLESETPPAELGELKQLTDFITARLALADQVERLVSGLHQARERAERLGEQVRLQRDATDEAEKRREAARGELDRAWGQLAAILDELSGDPTARDLVAPLRQALAEPELEVYRRSVEATCVEIEQRSASLDNVAARLDQTIGVATRQLDELRQRRAALEEAPEYAPDRSPDRQRAREVLTSLGIAARPLYELLDLRPDLPDHIGGRIERALLDAGLLDALVVRPEDAPRTMAALVEEDLRDAALDWSVLPGNRASDVSQAELVVDPAVADDDIWRGVAEQLLACLPFSSDGLLTWHPDGRWRHGLLSGAAGPGGRLGLLGATQRRERRLAEIASLREQELALVEEIGRRESEREQVRASQSILRALRRRVDGSVAESGLDLARQRLADREREAVEVRRRLSELVERKRQLDGEVREAQVHLEQIASVLDLTAERASDGRALAQLQEALRGAERSLALLVQQRETLSATWRHYHDLRSRHSDDLARRSDQEQLLRAAEERQARLQAAIEQLRAQLQGAEYQSLLVELEQLRAERQSTDRQIRDIDQAIAGDNGRLELERERIVEYQSDADEARARREQADAAFKEHLLRYRTPIVDAAREQSDAGATEAALQELLAPGESFSEDELEGAITAARKSFGDAYNEHRALIKSVAPTADLDDGRVMVQTTRHGACSLAQYIVYLGEEIALQESLIQEQHERFYKEVLMRHAAREIREAMARADEWLAGTSDLLRHLPFAQQRYSFALKPNPHSDTALARVFDAFRKSDVTFTEADAERLRQALAEEAERLRREFERGDRTEFTRQLEELFDYRSWISVEVRVDGRPLTDRAAQTASGGEQAFDFAVPLVVALAALHDNAGAFAPRLIAFDEAFMKASADNKSQMLRLLQHLGFQWLIASPDLPSKDVPVYAEYHLEYTKGEERAVMTPLLTRIAEQDGSVSGPSRPPLPSSDGPAALGG
ncbi:MAG: hypothetical protein EPO21_05825 [Chloroflexota bacterium]|nr:MAG: hypothetical protein EPO21_05825 [Chloroflexota bacterium]